MTKTEQLTEATAKRDEARTRYEACKTWNATKQDAADELEFWSNKVAFLDAWKEA